MHDGKVFFLTWSKSAQNNTLIISYSISIIEKSLNLVLYVLSLKDNLLTGNMKVEIIDKKTVQVRANVIGWITKPPTSNQN